MTRDEADRVLGSIEAQGLVNPLWNGIVRIDTDGTRVLVTLSHDTSLGRTLELCGTLDGCYFTELQELFHSSEFKENLYVDEDWAAYRSSNSKRRNTGEAGKPCTSCANGLGN